MATATVDSLFEQHTQQLDSSRLTFQKSLQEIAARWKSMIIDGSLGNDVQGKLAGQHIAIRAQQINSMLNQSGFHQLGQQFAEAHSLSRAYADAILEQVLPGTAQKLIGDTPMPDSVIRELINFDVEVFNQEIGPGAANAIARQLTFSVIAGVKRSISLENIEDQLEKFTDQASSFMDTALASFDRTVTGKIWEGAGLCSFRYLGPNDRSTRPFCRSHVGHVYPLIEIKAMHNGAGRFDNPWIYGGGIRCRHRWIPYQE
jgi:hypothetical protein